VGEETGVRCIALFYEEVRNSASALALPRGQCTCPGLHCPAAVVAVFLLSFFEFLFHFVFFLQVGSESAIVGAASPSLYNTLTRVLTSLAYSANPSAPPHQLQTAVQRSFKKSFLGQCSESAV